MERLLTPRVILMNFSIKLLGIETQKLHPLGRLILLMINSIGDFSSSASSVSRTPAARVHESKLASEQLIGMMIAI